MCFGKSGGHTTVHQYEKPLGSETSADGGFTQRRNDVYRRKAERQNPSSVAPTLDQPSQTKGVLLG